jgi:hypothetical protein
MTNNPHPPTQQTITTEDVEVLAPGVTIEWLSDHRIMIMTASDSSRGTVDVWINRSMELLREWPADKPWMTIIDATNPKVARTPYMRDRLHT